MKISKIFERLFFFSLIQALSLENRASPSLEIVCNLALDPNTSKEDIGGAYRVSLRFRRCRFVCLPFAETFRISNQRLSILGNDSLCTIWNLSCPTNSMSYFRQLQQSNIIGTLPIDWVEQTEETSRRLLLCSWMRLRRELRQRD